jgi:predicted CXXCH cytochrome family protein
MFQVLFMVCVLFGTVQSACALLVDSKHDFSYLGNSPCSYCHTVHNAIGTALRPAYQKEAPMVTKLYSSATMKYTPSLAIANYSDAPLCLTCHDAINVPVLNNPTITNLIQGKSTDINWGGRSLGDDHPIGFEFKPALDPKKFKVPVKALARFGPNRNEIWCCSCHNPHNNTHGAFLVASNAESALCLDCHNK